MSWRPKEGWDAHKIANAEKERVGQFGYSPSWADLVEAGADAMYQPAYEKGKADGRAEMLDEVRMQIAEGRES